MHATAVRGRAGIRTIALVILTLGLVALGMAPASAHHPTVTGDADCDGHVAWSTSAWSTPDEDARIHGDVQVSRSIDGGAMQHVASGEYSKSNGFTFSGSFDVDTPLPDSIKLEVVVVGPWDNGTAGGQKDTWSVNIPTDCQEPTPADPTGRQRHR